MKIEVALKKRDALVTSLRDAFSAARSFGSRSRDMTSKYLEVMERYRDCPVWVRSYAEGYWRALIDKAYESDLVYGGFVDGKFYSTHNSRPDYYDHNGISPSELASLWKDHGHYWIKYVDAGTPRAFFVSEKVA